MKIGRYLVAFILLMGLLIVFGNRGVVDNYLMGKKLASLTSDNHTIELENKELAKKILLLRNDFVYIEAIARNEMGMVKKGDMVYKLAQ